MVIDDEKAINRAAMLMAIAGAKHETMMTFLNLFCKNGMNPMAIGEFLQELRVDFYLEDLEFPAEEYKYLWNAQDGLS